MQNTLYAIRASLPAGFRRDGVRFEYGVWKLVEGPTERQLGEANLTHVRLDNLPAGVDPRALLGPFPVENPELLPEAEPAPDWAALLAEKDAEIARLSLKVRDLEDDIDQRYKAAVNTADDLDAALKKAAAAEAKAAELEKALKDAMTKAAVPGAGPASVAAADSPAAPAPAPQKEDKKGGQAGGGAAPQDGAAKP